MTGAGMDRAAVAMLDLCSNDRHFLTRLRFDPDAPSAIDIETVDRGRLSSRELAGNWGLSASENRDGGWRLPHHDHFHTRSRMAGPDPFRPVDDVMSDNSGPPTGPTGMPGHPYQGEARLVYMADPLHLQRLIWENRPVQMCMDILTAASAQFNLPPPDLSTITLASHTCGVRERFESSTGPPACQMPGLPDKATLGLAEGKLGVMLEESGFLLSSRIRAAYDVAKAVRVLRHDGGDSGPQALAWYGARGPTGDVRRQAASTMPVLAGLLASDERMRKAIDNRHEVSSVIRARYPGLGKGGVRRLVKLRSPGESRKSLAAIYGGGTTAEDVMGDVRDRSRTLSGRWRLESACKDLAAAANPNLVPSSDQDWDAFSTLYSGLMQPLELHLGMDMGAMIKSSKGAWYRLAMAVTGDLGLDNMNRHSANVVALDMADMTELAMWQLVVPAIHRQSRTIPALRVSNLEDAGLIRIQLDRQVQLREIARDIMIPPSSPQPVRAVAQLVRRGITRLNRLNSYLQQVRTGANANQARDVLRLYPFGFWPRPLADRDVWCHPDTGYTLAFITSKDELISEGKEMGHCIGGGYYSNRIDRGAAFAVRVLPSGSAKRATALFTIVIGEPGSLPRVQLSEIHGARNSRPDRDAVTACQALAAAFSSGSVALSDTLLIRREAKMEQDHIRNTGLSWTELCGHDPGDPATTCEIWTIWRDVIPKGRKFDFFDDMLIDMKPQLIAETATSPNPMDRPTL